MSRLCIAPIVEGHGEYSAIRSLLERIWFEIVGGEFLEVVRPIRRPRTKLVKEDRDDLRRAVDLAVLKLAECSARALVLLLLDADQDPACVLGPRLLAAAHGARPDIDIACVLPTPDYEAWFVASAESLREQLGLAHDVELPADPEALHRGKSWIRLHYPAYSETVDQPSLTATMDLALCRQRSRSFDKLCRELEKRADG